MNWFAPGKRVEVWILIGISMATPLLSQDDPKSRDEKLWKASANPKIVAAGKENYKALCLNCHGDENIKGDSPSNLFDSKWYHGDTPHEIEQNIRNGFPEKMPAWKEVMAPEDVEATVAYLLSFQAKNRQSK